MWTTWIVIVAACVAALLVALVNMGKSNRYTKLSDSPLCLVLVVSDAAPTIEGVLRSLIMRMSAARAGSEIVVIDAEASTETQAIVTNMAREHPALEYRTATSAGVLATELERACLGLHRFSIVYDLRSTSFRDIPRDMTRFC